MFLHEATLRGFEAKGVYEAMGSDELRRLARIAEERTAEIEQGGDNKTAFKRVQGVWPDWAYWQAMYYRY